MRFDELKAPPGAHHNRKRIGRGNSSGQGTYAGRGVKGQNARTGGGVRPSFEGGQLPLVKRLPTQRGFTNIFKKYFSTVNVDSLEERFPPNADITPEGMKDARLIRGLSLPVKVLGRGEISQAMTVRAHRFSDEARRKIEAAGGKAVDV